MGIIGPKNNTRLSCGIECKMHEIWQPKLTKIIQNGTYIFILFKIVWNGHNCLDTSIRNLEDNLLEKISDLCIYVVINTIN